VAPLAPGLEFDGVEKTTLWSRVGDWVRNSRRSLGWDSDPDADAALSNDLAGPSPDESRSPDDNGVDSLPWYRLGGVRSRVVEIGLEIRHLAELLDSMRTELARQSESVRLANCAIDRLSASLASTPDALRAQADLLVAINLRLDADAADIRQIRGSLSQLSGLGDSMRDTTASVTRFAETSQRDAEALAAGLERVRQAVTQLDNSSAAVLRSFGDLRSELRERSDEISASVVALNRRITWFASFALAMAAIAVAMGALLLLR